ncbi:hypothetical protein D9M68_697750 [compost metagenome]
MGARADRGESPGQPDGSGAIRAGSAPLPAAGPAVAPHPGRYRARCVAYRYRRPAGPGRAPHGAGAGLALHHLVPHDVSRLSAGAHGHSGGLALALPALVPPAVAARAGADAHGARHPGAARPGEPADLVAGRRSPQVPAGPAQRGIRRPAPSGLPERRAGRAGKEPGCLPVARLARQQGGRRRRAGRGAPEKAFPRRGLHRHAA